MKILQTILDEKKHKAVISIAPNRPVFDALVILAEYKFGALVVLDNDQLVGIFSERDYAREVILKGKSSKTTLISEIMTKQVLTGKLTDSVESAMQLMSEKRIRHLPVVDNSKVVGMLSMGDLVQETIAYQKTLIEQLQTYINS